MSNIPPQAIEIEESILASCILYPDDLELVAELLQPSDFYRTAHRIIFSECLDLFELKKPVDLPTLTTCLRDSGRLDQAGGPSGLAALLADCPVSTSIEHHCAIIKEKSMLRDLIGAAHGIQKDCASGASAADALNDAQKRILEIAAPDSRQVFFTSKDLTADAAERYQERFHSRKTGKLTGIASGFSNLDGLTGGFQKSDLIICAARPGMGKSALAHNIMLNATGKGHSLLFFSLEMSKEQIADRVVSSVSGINGARFRWGDFSNIDLEAINHACSYVHGLPFVIDDSGGLHFREIIRRTRRARRDFGTEMVLVDYLQLISGDSGQGRNYEIESITRGLKGLAKELQIPVFLISQLSRECEKREDKRPRLSDLRDSGAIEQDADLVLFIYRPAYYGRGENNVAELDIAKQRNGPTGRIKLTWNERITKFTAEI